LGKVEKPIKKKTKQVNEKRQQEVVEEGAKRRRKVTPRVRRARLAKSIRAHCDSNTVLPNSSVLRLCRDAARYSVGRQVKMQAKAGVCIHNTAESLVVELLRSAAKYIPKTQQTIQREHICMALEAPFFKEAFRIVDGRMNVRAAASS